jgi:hypothetical protein
MLYYMAHPKDGDEQTGIDTSILSAICSGRVAT